ncbi:hypothetical protein B0T20DRAFT_397343 [Sordaria brevicollis]|uniref:Uncharacterized protein n=1 Tax=Sordaria brevicollis TaxID=83679 RepID=A0AAE0NWD9_SORBR|nr:hypothetical protein B0T20DRAFT_397343 [Sordaria brevicollis]
MGNTATRTKHGRILKYFEVSARFIIFFRPLQEIPPTTGLETYDHMIGHTGNTSKAWTEYGRAGILLIDNMALTASSSFSLFKNSLPRLDTYDHVEGNAGNRGKTWASWHFLTDSITLPPRHQRGHYPQQQAQFEVALRINFPLQRLNTHDDKNHDGQHGKREKHRKYGQNMSELEFPGLETQDQLMGNMDNKNMNKAGSS